MEQNLEAQVQKRLAELPQDVRDAIQSVDLSKKVQAIGQKQGLHIDQIGDLEDETILIMLGFAEPKEFVDQLVATLLVTPAQADAIASDVADDIFMPIRESMKAWAEKKRGGEELPASAPAAVSVPQPEPASTPQVVMPSAAKPVLEPAAPEAPVEVVAVAPLLTPISVGPKPAVVPDLMAAEVMLSEKKVSTPIAPSSPSPAVAPAASPATDPTLPQNYKADPYREPVE
ncbi:MAG: seg [Candidatus Adlerbacteria bacterium]|nr:seg [Candidatus Adlerbacteria bacterium]